MDNTNKGKCILMCAGQYFGDKIEKAPGDLVIAVDGGLRHLIDRGVQPDLVIGDFDSLESEYEDALAQYRKAGDGVFYQLPVVKDDTDTLAAVKLGYERGYRTFEIYGGLGGRLDHTMANVQTLVWLVRRGASGILRDRETDVTVIGKGVFRLPASFEGTVSLFALDERLTDVTIQGMKYNVEHVTVTNDFPVGCSNETVSRAGEAGGSEDKAAGSEIPAQISIGSGTGLLIMTAHLKNRHH